jgi:hypothetical protein
VRNQRLDGGAQIMIILYLSNAAVTFPMPLQPFLTLEKSSNLDMSTITDWTKDVPKKCFCNACTAEIEKMVDAES